ncbi:TetR/AcrR family transcriptional regulator [Butyrivibrio sp. X503]|nr:TetR/AcrR family transcriptional regulator [Butyrivibrio sp. X503]
MPPKPRFTREQMVDAGLELVRQKGADALTARELADVLGCSARPIFTAFENMDELRSEVKKAARMLVSSYANEAMKFDPPFKKAGMQIILFASREPNLFKMIFMSSFDKPTSFDEVFSSHIVDNKFEEVISNVYSLSSKQARYLFEHMWIYTYGISVLCALNQCNFSDAELSNLLGAEFLSLLEYVRNNNLERQLDPPERVKSGNA